MIVLDTHVWLWWVSDPAKLSRVAARNIKAASSIGIPAVSCFEVAAAVAKRRISLDRDTLEWLQQSLTLPRVELLPLSPAIAVKATQLGRSFPGDPADRLIVASALLASAPLVTKDERIRSYPAIEAVW
jgi:PIN domain nuclease of toxin-antitoxin system